MRFVLPFLALFLGCTALESPRQRATSSVERLAAKGLDLSLPSGGTIRIPPGAVKVLAMDAYQRERGKLEAFAQLSLEGRVGDVSLSYLGNEKMRFDCSASACTVDGALAARMVEVVDLLERRRQALTEGDLGSLSLLAKTPGPLEVEALRRASSLGISAWFIRVESDSAVVGEAGHDPGQKRLLLEKGEDGWKIAGGLL